MEEVFVEYQRFEDMDYTIENFDIGEYEGCTFKNCDFSNSDLSDIVFVDCEFLECNLSMIKTEGTSFRDVIFKDSKIFGLHFGTCNEFGLIVTFRGCMLNYSSFFNIRVKDTTFKDCDLQEVDFSRCDLTRSNFDNCNLRKAIFNNSNLEKTNFVTSYAYAIDPEENKMKKAKFSLEGSIGLLSKYEIEIEG